MAQIAAQKCDFSCDEVALLYCKGCDQFLCIECRQNVHDRVRKFKEHEVVDIHKEGNRVRPNPVCETHENQFLYYCSKCECLTCAECMTSSHNEHKTEKIKNVADARRQNVNQIIEQLKTKVEIVKRKLETIDTEHSIQVKSDCESYVKTVEETVDDLHKIVDRHKLIPMTTASDFKDIENEDLGRKRAFFRNRQDKMVDRLLKFENLLLETHDSTFLMEWKAIQTDVQMNDEKTDHPLVAPRRIESFDQKKLTRSVIEEIDEKFQMKLREQEQAVVRLTEGIGALKDKLKGKQEQIDDMSSNMSKLLQGLKEQERMVTGLQDENKKITTEFKQREMKAFSQLKEKEKRVNILLDENDKLKSNIKIKQDELEKMSNEVDTKADLTNKLTIHLEDKIKDLESKLKQCEKKNTAHNCTDYKISGNCVDDLQIKDDLETKKRLSNMMQSNTDNRSDGVYANKEYEGLNVRASIRTSTSKMTLKTPVKDFQNQTKISQVDQHFSQKCSIMPQHVLPKNLENYSLHSLQTGSRENCQKQRNTKTDTTGNASSGVSERNVCYLSMDRKDVNTAFGSSTSPSAPFKDFQTKSTPDEQHLKNQYNMMPKPVLPIGQRNIQLHSLQSGISDNDKTRINNASFIPEFGQTSLQSADDNDKLPEEDETEITDPSTITAGNLHTQNIWFCNKNRERIFRLCLSGVIVTASKEAYKDKNLVVDRDTQHIRICTTKHFASTMFELEEAFNNLNDHGDQQTRSDLNTNVAGNFPGSSTDMTELKTLQLKKLEFSVLQNLDFISFLNKEIPTCKAELNQNALTFNGTQKEVEKKMQTFFDYYIDIECVKNVQGKTTLIPEKMLEFVEKENIREYIDKKLEKEDILCYWYSDRDEGYIKLYTLKGKGSKAVTVVQQCLDWEEFSRTADQDEILKTKSFSKFLDDQKLNLMFDIYEEDLVVVGLESCMRNFNDLYHKIVQANTKIKSKQTLNQHKERTDLSPNIFAHLRKYKSEELEKFERKWNVNFTEENEVVMLVGETSAVKKALDSLKNGLYIEQKWSCHMDKPDDVIKELSSKIIPQLENQFCCSVFTDINSNCISHRQLAQWVTPTKQAKDQRIVFVHGSVTDMAADVIICPVTKAGGPPSFGKIGKAIFKLGGSVMQKEVQEMPRFEDIVISSATGNLPCLMVAYFPVPYFKPGVQLQKEMVKRIQDILTEVEITQLQSVVITTDIGNDIPESTFLHWFIDAYKACQNKLSCINQIYLCTESENVLPLLDVLRLGLTNYLRMFDFTAMFEQRSGRVSGIKKPANISISLVKGKLIDQKVDILVNSSNRNLELEKGAVSVSILEAAGEGIYAECKQLHPKGIHFGEVIATTPGKLPCKAICHGCLPFWKPVADISCQILAKLVFGCLIHAESYKSESIAFPVFGTGNLLYPWDEVAKTMMSTAYKYGRMFPNTTIMEVRIVLYDKDINSIQAFEHEKMNMEEVQMRPEDPLPLPSNILECRCKNVRVKIEPLSGVEFHHCKAIVLMFSYQEALDIERDDPHSKLTRDKLTINRSKRHKFWVITVIVEEKIQTFNQAIKRALTLSEEKRLSTLAIGLMMNEEGLTLSKQATIIRNCVDNRENTYLQILKMMITSREDYDKILAETIYKQEIDRQSLQHKFSDWFNVSKTQWKCVKYSEPLQSPRLYLTIVGEDEKNMATVLQKLTEEINVLKIQGCQNLGASIRSVKTKPEQKGYGWIRTSKKNEKVKIPADVCRQLDEAVKYKLPNAEIKEEDGVYIYDIRTSHYSIQGSDSSTLGIFTRDVDWQSGDSEFTSNMSLQNEIQHEDDFGVVTGMINPDLHGQQSLLKQECKRANVLLNNDTFEAEGN